MSPGGAGGFPGGGGSLGGGAAGSAESVPVFLCLQCVCGCIAVPFWHGRQPAI